jgi:AraC-like DNA-binding protein
MSTSLKSIDPLGEALHFLRMTGVFYCRSELSEPFGLALPAFDSCMMFHVVTAGQCWLRVDGAEDCLLRPGDLALVPHGEGHSLLSDRDAAAQGLFDLPRELISERYEVLRHGGGGTAATAICGVVRFDHPAAEQLLRLLPRWIKVDAWSSPEMEWIQSTLRFITAEARELRAGGETVITRLADILVIQSIRSWLAEDPAAHTGWLGALRNREIGRAIALIHRNPEQSWSVESLAKAVGLSRSAFSARFTELVGEPVMRYATRWKINSAMLLLRENDAPLAAVANRLGYDSEAAFNRAFKRFTGMTPGAARRARPVGGAAADAAATQSAALAQGSSAVPRAVPATPQPTPRAARSAASRPRARKRRDRAPSPRNRR